MKDLIEKLQKDVNLSAEQAEKALHSIKEHITEKFPMIKDAVNSIFAGGADTSSTEDPLESSSWMDKISDVVPGEIGEKLESFAKKAAEEGSEAFDKATDYAKEMYEKGKKQLEDIS